MVATVTEPNLTKEDAVHIGHGHELLDGELHGELDLSLPDGRQHKRSATCGTGTTAARPIELVYVRRGHVDLQ